MVKPSVNIPANRGQYNPFSSVGATSTPTDIDTSISQYEALVIDVIVSDKHPKYQSDGYNVGAIQFRALASDQYRPTDYLNWALPADINITDYPLLNEVVVVFSVMNRWYYHRRMNVTAGITSHAMPGLATELGPINTEDQSQDTRNNAMNGNPVVKTAASAPATLGKNFKEPDSIYRLRHDEGDIIFEGRSGASMRFGHAWLDGTLFKATKKDQSPNILIRVGQDSNAKPSVKSPYGLVTEDIDKDASSIYIVSDQLIPLTLSTANAEVNGLSIRNFPRRLDGNQIVLNTDRLVINAKKGKIMGFALDGVHWTSSKDFSIDAEEDYLSHIKRDVKVWVNGSYSMTTKGSNSFIGPKNYLGTQNDESQPIPLGAVLAQFLSDFIDAHLNSAGNHTLGVDPQGGVVVGALSPGVVSALAQLKSDVAKGKYASFNSSNSYTTK